jgi:predicted RNA-binding Zn-ribbon protein involved in translation (DUF1610 family)
MELVQFFQKFSSEEICYAYLERVVWSDGRICPKCGVIGESWRLKSKPHYYECKCGHQFSVTANTLFHKTRIPLVKWFAAIFLLADSSKGISTNKAAKWLGLHYQTAWHMTQRIRAMMADADPAVLTGIVELDETYVGGKPRFTRDENGVVVKHKTGRGTDKQAVFVAVERNGNVRADLIDSHGVTDIKPLVNQWVDRDAQLMTDELPAYKGIGRDYRYHHVVFHKDREYARDGGIHNNTAESFNSTIKRAVIGVYHYVSKKHMIRYVEEAVFRWNTRRSTNMERFDLILTQSVGRLLPFKYLTGN